MNGVHDMGGMDGLGAVDPDPDEPTFHHDWESRALALTLATPARWTLDASRHQRELIPGADYLKMSYYEKWITALSRLIVDHGLVTAQELTSGVPDPAAVKFKAPLRAKDVAAALTRGGPTTRDAPRLAAFQLGDRVRALNLNPLGHTRLPRYVRGHVGTVIAHHGVHVFPDTNAHGLGEHPHHLYGVRFAAQDLWGGRASSQDGVYLDLWEPYLERT